MKVSQKLNLLFLACCLPLWVACDDLTIFAPRPQAFVPFQLTQVEINEDGYLHLEWETSSSYQLSNQSNFDIYQMEVPDTSEALDFSQQAETGLQLTHELVKGVAENEAPKTNGQLLGSVAERSFVSSQLIKPGKVYALQIVQRGRSLSDDNKKILLVRAELDSFSATASDVTSDLLILSWNAVPGANRYLIYTDEAMTQLLGETISTSLSIDLKKNPVQKSYYVQAFRGAQPATDVKKIDIVGSSAKVVKVTPISPDKSYKADDVLAFSVEFSEPVTSFGSVSLPLIVGTRTVQASYVSGSGQKTLRFEYKVAPGDNAEGLGNGTVLIGSFVDAAGQSISGTLPRTDSNNGLSTQNQIIVDTLAPTSPSAPIFDHAYSQNGQLVSSWTKGSDLYWKQDEFKLCAQNSCNSGCGTITSTSLSSYTSTGLNDGLYYACVRSVDTAGNASNWVPSATASTVDTLAPSVVKVYASTANGVYKAGDVIDILVEFSESVWVSSGGDLTLVLETGTTDRNAVYTSGSGSKLLSFRYVVQNGDNANPLNYVGINSLILNSGTLRDIVDISADLLLPPSVLANSLGSRSQIIIDTTPPAAPLISSPAPASYLTNAKPTIVGTAEANALIRIYSGATEIASTQATTGGAFSIALPSALADGPYTLTARAFDAIGNQSLASAAVGITIDTIVPSTPSAPSFADTRTNNPNVSLSWTDSSDTNFNTHNVKLCSNSACDLGCVNATTSSNSPATLSGSNGSTYYGCVQGLDLAGQSSAWVASTGTITVDTQNPSITRVTSSTTDGTFKAGDSISLQIKFSEIVHVTGEGDFALQLETGDTDHNAVYVSGSGTDTLNFSYTVQSGDTSSDLNYSSVNALSLGSGTIKDASDNAANITLPLLGSSNSLAGQKALVLDTTAPLPPVITSPLDGSYAAPSLQTISGSSEANALIKVYSGATEIGSVQATGTTWSLTLGSALGDGNYNLSATAADSVGNVSASSVAVAATVDTVSPTPPSAVHFAGAVTNTANFDIEWTESSDSNFDTHNVKICTSNDCTNGCTSLTSSVNSPTSVLGSNGATYFGCIQGVDRAGNASAWIASSASIDVDMNNPSIINISSSTADGYYKVGAVISIQVKFSEDVYVTDGNYFALKLETGSSDHDALYASGSGSDTLTFTYTVQAGDATGDLNYRSTNALSLGAGTIKDISNNNADLTLPSLASSNSIAGQKAIVIDTTAPNAPVITSPLNGTYRTSDLTTISGTSETNAAIQVYSGGSLLASTTAVGTSWSVTLSSPLADGAYNLSAKATDLALNESSDSAGVLVTVDKIVPTNPSSVGFAGSYSTSTSFNVSWVNSTDVNFQTHNVMICTVSSCDSGCSSSTTSTASPATVTGSHGNTYYACVQGLDRAGQTSAWVASTSSISVDTSIPSISRVTSSTVNGTYKAGDTISIQVKFSEAVYVTGGSNLALLMESGTNDHNASYVSGSGTDTLSFTYTVQAGDSSNDFDYKSDSSLTLGGDSIKDSAGNDANLSLPSPGSANSLAGQKALVLDTTPPAVPVITSPTNASYATSQLTSISGTSEANVTIKVYSGSTEIGSTTMGSTSWSVTLGSALSDGVYSLTAKATDAVGNESAASAAVSVTVDTINPSNPSSVGFAGNLSNSTTFNLSWANSTDTNFSTHNAKICTNTACNAGCISDTTATASPASMTGVHGATYYGCVQGLDLAGRTSAWTSSIGTITIDTAAPTVSSVTSSKADGAYKAGEVIPISITFSETVVVTGGANLGLLLETGTTDRTAVYDSGSGSTTLIFNYTVQSGDNTNDLNYESVNALTKGAGTITDNAGNAAVLSLPALASASSLAGQKAIVIDAVAPNTPVFTSPTNSAALSSPITQLQGTAEANSTVEIFKGATSLGTTTASAGGSWSYTLSPSIVVDGSYSFSALARDAVGNESAKATISVTLTIPPATANAGPDKVTNTSLTLLGSSSNATSVQWSKQSGPGSVSFGSATSNTTTVSFGAQGTYVLRLTATNSGGFSVYDEVTVIYDTTAPSFSGLTQILQESATEVRIFWTAATDTYTASTAITYELCYSSTLGSCTSSFTANVTMDSNNWDRSISGLTAGTVYEFVVRAFDAAGNSTSGGKVMYSGGLANIKEIVGKQYGKCALLTSGAVKCWGNNDDSQLGPAISDTSLDLNSPVTVTGLTGVKSLGAGEGHYCALMNDDTVKCWGRGANGQLGQGADVANKSTPVTVSGISGVSKIAVGSLHSCALITSDGSVKCWGRNDVGQLGNGGTSDSGTPTTVSGVTGAVDLKVGNHFSCALMGDKTLKCWGRNNFGQVGNGNTTSPQPTPVSVSLSNVEKYALGEAFVCASVTSGQVYCWGYGNYGNLGQGDNSSKSSPTAVSTLTSGVVNFYAGYGFVCAKINDGSYKCWGDNGMGQLGNDSTTQIKTPTTIANLNGMTQLSAAERASMCGQGADGFWRCWGRDETGELGDGRVRMIASPAEVKSLRNLAVAVGLGTDHSCALLSDETVACWGAMESGQIGGSKSGTDKINSNEPRIISGLSGVKKLIVGNYHSCALLSDSSVKCWGRNTDGQLGNNSTTHSETPQTVLSSSGSGSLSDVVDLAAGPTSTCAILSNGSMQCWGKAANGVLGNGVTTPNALYPVVSSVFSSMTIKSAALGVDHLCVLLGDASKTVKCVGSNYYKQLGDGTSSDKTSPGTTMTGVTKIASYNYASCALKTDQTVWCWGYGAYGQRGDGSTATVTTPVQVTGITNAVGIEVGSKVSCALLAGNNIKCWGTNLGLVLGDPTISQDAVSASPVEVAGVSLASSMAVGYSHGCMIQTDGRLMCWGYNNKQQVGLNSADGWQLKPSNIVINYSLGD